MGAVCAVHGCGGYGAWVRWVRCMGAVGTVHGCGGYGAWVRWVGCMGAVGTVHGCGEFYVNAPHCNHHTASTVPAVLHHV